MREKLAARLSLMLNVQRHIHALQATRGEQMLLRLEYERLVRDGGPMPPWPQVEFRNYSQNGEDGILLFLASVLGIRGGRIVELCCGNGVESNSANLILNHGWSGLLVDGSEDMIAVAENFYTAQPETRRVGPTIVNEWVTSRGVTGMLAKHGFATDIDVVSLDLDSIDLWVAQALAGCGAKVMIVEYNNRIPASESLSVPDADDFKAAGGHNQLQDGLGYFGASLAAFDAVLAGHRLVGANSENTNALFVREGLAPDLLPAVSVESCLSSPWARRQQERHWDALARCDWVRVS